MVKTAYGHLISCFHTFSRTVSQSQMLMSVDKLKQVNPNKPKEQEYLSYILELLFWLWIYKVDYI